MSDDRLPVGPFKVLKLEDGKDVPYYIMPYDKKGKVRAPETLRHLEKALETGDYSDVYVFSHGWNNDWTVATERYQRFIEGFVAARKARGTAVDPEYRPLLIGIFWPSTSLVFGSKERGPGFSSVGIPQPVAIAQEQAELDAISEMLDEKSAKRLYELAQKRSLNAGEARELAQMSATLESNRGPDEVGSDGAPSAETTLALWEWQYGDDAVGGFSAVTNRVRTAGVGEVFSKLDPRELIRVMTVAVMKDRAAVVGKNGVSGLLDILLKPGTKGRVHLVGHSYGAQVVLAATCSSAVWNNRKITSMLLLQPAVSHLCFSDSIPEINKPGGYRVAMDRVESPILATYSEHDVPLSHAFHIGLRREKDLGEQRLSAVGSPPSKYAALGGYGPRGQGCATAKLLAPGVAYNFDPAVKVYGLDGSEFIPGHGDISKPATWWALQSLVSR